MLSTNFFGAGVHFRDVPCLSIASMCMNNGRERENIVWKLKIENWRWE